MNRFESIYTPILNPILDDKWITPLPTPVRPPVTQPGKSKVDVGINVKGDPISIPIAGSIGTFPQVTLPVIGQTPSPTMSLPKNYDLDQSTNYAPYIIAGGLALLWYMKR